MILKSLTNASLSHINDLGLFTSLPMYFFKLLGYSSNLVVTAFPTCIVYPFNLQVHYFLLQEFLLELQVLGFICSTAGVLPEGVIL